MFQYLVCAVALCAIQLTATAADDLPDSIQAILRDHIDFDKKSVGIVVGIVDEHGTKVVSYGHMDTYQGDPSDPLSLHKYLYAQDDPVDGSDSSGNDDDSLDSMSMAVYSSVFQSSLNTLESVGVVSAATAPYPVLVVTMGSKQYMPETTVKDDAQAAIVPGAVKGVTKIYIAVPPTANPQAMVNYWSNHSFWDNEFAFRDYFKIGGAHDYKNDKQFADRAIFDAFGNFNYGACGEAAGVPRWLLQHEANKGKPGGNNPINTADINSGFDAI